MKISPGRSHGFNGGPRMRMTNKISAIADAVKAAEMKRIPDVLHGAPNSNFNLAYHVTDGIRKSLYIPTDIRRTGELLDNVYTSGHLPDDEINAADLGSGLGAFSFSLAAYSEYLNLERFSATGFEISPSLLAGARGIAKDLNIEKVSFVHRDFTELIRSDFKRFNLVYIFMPFLEDFVDVMDDVYPRIAPGTILLTRHCPNQRVLRSGLFKLLDKPLEEFYGDAYHLYMRTNEERLMH